MKTIAALSGIAAVVWLMAGANMMVTAQDSEASGWGLAVSFVGAALAVIWALAMKRLAR